MKSSTASDDCERLQLSAIADESSFTLFWQRGSGPLPSGYEVHRAVNSGAFAPVGQTGAGQTSLQNGGIGSGNVYDYKVRVQGGAQFSAPIRAFRDTVSGGVSDAQFFDHAEAGDMSVTLYNFGVTRATADLAPAGGGCALKLVLDGGSVFREIDVQPGASGAIRVPNASATTYFLTIEPPLLCSASTDYAVVESNTLTAGPGGRDVPIYSRASAAALLGLAAAVTLTKRRRHLCRTA